MLYYATHQAVSRDPSDPCLGALMSTQVLADVVKVVTPTAKVAAEPNSPSWLRQLPTGVTASNGLTFTSAADCPGISTAANSADRCQRAEPARICPNAYR